MIRRDKDLPCPREAQLTPCEFQVCFELVNTALVHKQIAAKLGKSVKTVEVQIASAYKKLGVTSRCELIQRFNSEREVAVKSLPSPGMLNRILRRLDELESVINELLIEERGALRPIAKKLPLPRHTMSENAIVANSHAPTVSRQISRVSAL
jgi:DNA-binding CsgD family transcriptional regulator